MVRTRRGATPVAPAPVVQPATAPTTTEVSGEGVVSVAATATTADDTVQGTGGGGGETAMDVDVAPPPEGEGEDKEQPPEVVPGAETTPQNLPEEGSQSQPQEKDKEDVTGTAEKVAAEEAEFVVLEEEDGGGEKDGDDDPIIIPMGGGEQEDDDAGNSERKEEALSSAIDAVNLNENFTEMEQDGEKTENGETKSTPAAGEGEQQGNEVILVNPLFGKASRPVIAIDSSSDSEGEEHFSEDDDVNNFQGSQPHCGGVDGNLGDGQGGADHGCNCFQEKGILIAEIERLRKAIGELGSRHSLLEDFIQVEYSEKFKTFLKNREHLMGMGFGAGAGETDLLDGKKSEKSAELVELLVMIKEQGSAKSKEDSTSKSTLGNSSGSTSQKPVSAPSSSSQSKISSTPKGGRVSGGGTTSSSRQNSRPKPIPSLNSSRDREERDNTKVWDYPPSNPSYSGYPSRPEIEMIAQVRGGVPPPITLQDYQYQQQVIAQQRQLQASAQSRYFDTMYANVGGGGSGKDYTTTAVQRTNLFPSDPGNSVIGHMGNKQERKRKRDSQGSASSLNGSNNVPNPMARAQPLEVQMQGRKKCPMCTAIVKQKKLKDHLIASHNQVKMTCPVCREEFSMKRKLHLHMRDEHQLSESECSSYAEKAYNNITEHIGVWLRKMMNEAKTPNREQMAAQLKYNEDRLRSAGLAKPGTGSGRPSGSSNAPGSSSGTRIFTGSRGHFSASASPAVDMYGPGGYAQYASRYLQQRSGAGTSTNRLYTPF